MGACCLWFTAPLTRSGMEFHRRMKVCTERAVAHLSVLPTPFQNATTLSLSLSNSLLFSHSLQLRNVFPQDLTLVYIYLTVAEAHCLIVVHGFLTSAWNLSLPHVAFGFGVSVSSLCARDAFRRDKSAFEFSLTLSFTISPPSLWGGYLNSSFQMLSRICQCSHSSHLYSTHIDANQTRLKSFYLEK